MENTENTQQEVPVLSLEQFREQLEYRKHSVYWNGKLMFYKSNHPTNSMNEYAVYKLMISFGKIQKPESGLGEKLASTARFDEPVSCAMLDLQDEFARNGEV